MPYRVTEQGVARQERRRARIIGAASRLFATEGYETTTMQQVVAEAGTSIGNCYYYFPNKEALLLAVIATFSERIEHAIDEALAHTPDGAERLAVAVYLGVQTLTKHAALARLCFTQTGQRAAAAEHFTARVRRFFETHPELLGDVDPVTAACAWEGSLFHVIEAMLSGAVPMDGDKAGRFLARWNLQALGLSDSKVRQALAAIDWIDWSAARTDTTDSEE